MRQETIHREYRYTITAWRTRCLPLIETVLIRLHGGRAFEEWVATIERNGIEDVFTANIFNNPPFWRVPSREWLNQVTMMIYLEVRLPGTFDDIEANLRVVEKKLGITSQQKKGEHFGRLRAL